MTRTDSFEPKGGFRARFLGVLALTGVAAACSDAPVAPTLDTPTPPAPMESQASAHLSAGLADGLEAGTLDSHLVLFRGNGEPAGFRDEVASLGGELVGIHPRAGIAVVAGLGAAGAEALRTLRGIEAVEEDQIVDLDMPFTGEVLNVEAGGLMGEHVNPAGAFFFPRQWHLRAAGADRAWAAGFTGTPDVTVAILDTGIGYIHPDLAGLVDLDRSASFIPSDDQLVQLVFPGAHPSADLNFHGTHVAATVASNALAAAGVTAHTTLMAVKVCNVQGLCPTSAVLLGMLHAADNGADVANMSLGGAFLKSGSGGFHSLINRVLNYVRQQGTLVVVAAGNSAFPMDQIPNAFFSYCDAPGVVCVSATGPTATAGVNGPWLNVDAPAPYTNWGRSRIDVAAPGGAASGVWAACSPFSLIQGLTPCQTAVFILELSGTSMAAPHVSGLAALLVAEHGKGRPATIRSRILQTADQLGSSGQDPFYGRGRINMPAALGVE